MALQLSLFGGPPEVLVPMFCTSPWFFMTSSTLSLPDCCLQVHPAPHLGPFILCVPSLLTLHLGSFHFVSALQLSLTLGSHPSLSLPLSLDKQTRIPSLILDGSSGTWVGHCYQPLSRLG